jgi:hypothetical protein
MSDKELVKALKLLAFVHNDGAITQAALRIELLATTNEQLVAINEALTEQLEAARADAKEAEAYAEELEKELSVCRMAQAVMENTVAEAVKMLDEQDRKYNRMTNDMIERHAAKLAKAVEALVSLEKQASTTSSRGAVTGLHWTHLTVAILKARATLAEIEGLGVKQTG